MSAPTVSSEPSDEAIEARRELWASQLELASNQNDPGSQGSSFNTLVPTP